MASPFPGMDLFLEDPAYWADFHSRFINAWCEAIAETLPAHYEASIGERVYLVEQELEAHKPGYPDLAVTQSETIAPAASVAAAGTTTLEQSPFP